MAKPNQHRGTRDCGITLSASARCWEGDSLQSGSKTAHS